MQVVDPKITIVQLISLLNPGSTATPAGMDQGSDFISDFRAMLSRSRSVPLCPVFGLAPRSGNSGSHPWAARDS